MAGRGSVSSQLLPGSECGGRKARRIRHDGDAKWRPWDGGRFVNRDWGTKQREPEFGLSNSPFSFDDFRYLFSVISVHVE